MRTPITTVFVTITQRGNLSDELQMYNVLHSWVRHIKQSLTPYIDWALFTKLSVIDSSDSVIVSNEKLSSTNNTYIPFKYDLKAVLMNFRFNFNI